MNPGHRTQTVVRHWIDLDEREQFDVLNWNHKPHRVTALYAEVVDGTLSHCDGSARRLLKSGQPGNVPASVSFYHGRDGWDKAHAILRARGVEGVPA